MIPTRRTTGFSIPTILMGTIVVTMTLACRGSDRSSDAYTKMVERAMPDIEKAVGLKFKTPPKVESRTRAQIREFVLQQVNDSLAQSQLAGIERAYKAFGLIPDTLDLQRFLVDLFEEQIEGYYDPKTKVLYVVDGAPNDALKMTITHELVHALQDQYVNLDSLQRLTGNNDQQSADQAIFEGQAVYEQLVAMSGSNTLAITLPGGWERVRQLIRNNRSAMPIYSAAPLIIQETLLFPYLSGAEFVKTYKERTNGGVPFEDMPVSTEQIMHPSAFFDQRDTPTVVRFAPTLRVAPIYENTLGEFETRVFLYDFVNDQDASVRAASGWDGDRYVIFSTPRGDGVAWASVWDSKADAGEFYSLLQRVAETRGKRQSHRRSLVTTGESNGRPVVLFVNVPAGIDPNLVVLNDVRIGAE